MGHTFKSTMTEFLLRALRSEPGTAAIKSLIPLDLLSLNKDVKNDMA
jgi:hypothetical protein